MQQVAAIVRVPPPFDVILESSSFFFFYFEKLISRARAAQLEPARPIGWRAT